MEFTLGNEYEDRVKSQNSGSFCITDLDTLDLAKNGEPARCDDPAQERKVYNCLYFAGQCKLGA